MLKYLIKLPFLKRIIPHYYKLYLRLFRIKNTKFIFENLIFDLDTRYLIDRHFYFTGSYEEEEFIYLNSKIKKNNIKYFLDIGACWGIYSLRIANKFKNINVQSFEPIVKNKKRLDDSILLNNISNIKSHNTAIGNYDGKLDLNVDSNFSPNYYFKKNEKSIQTEVCKLSKLDSLLSIKNTTIAIKIDVEAYELEALLGAKNLLTNNKCIVLIEIDANNKKNVFNFFKENDFKFEKFSKSEGNNYFFSNL